MTALRRIHTGRRMSMAVVHGGIVYVSGQVALDYAAADAATQTSAVLVSIDDVLAEAGSSKDRLLSASIWLVDMADFDAMNAEWESWLPPGCAPARATVGAKLALPGLLVEIAVTAAVD